MPLRIKIKVALIITAYLLGAVLIYEFLWLNLSIIYLLLGVYYLYKIYPKFDFTSDIIFRNKERLVALTFDDGPTKGFTQDILKILAEKAVPATFFIVGTKAMNNKDILKKIVIQGCELGAHTNNHVKLHNACEQQIQEEISPVIKLINDVYAEVGRLDQFKKIFRAPHGFKNISLKVYLKHHSIKLIPWTRGVWDTDAPGEEHILKSATKKPANNEIILLHDGLGLDNVSNKQKDGLIRALPKIIDFYRSNGFTFIKVSELIK